MALAAVQGVVEVDAAAEVVGAAVVAAVKEVKVASALTAACATFAWRKATM